MNVRKLLRCAVPVALVFFASGCFFMEEAARRKIQIYDLNQRKVIAVLDHVCSESEWREIFERYPDFKDRTFATRQPMNDQRTIVRQYTFQGEGLRQWDIPERIRSDFSVRGNHLVYDDFFEGDKGSVKRLMLRQLSDPAKPGVPISPNPTTQSLAGLNEPPFVFLTDDTLLCVMESDDDGCEDVQLWKVWLTTGEKARLPHPVQYLEVDHCLSSDLSGCHHAAQLSKNEILFLDNDANEVSRLSVNFRIYKKWWDENHLYWVYDFLGGAYACYDVEKKKIVRQGSLPRREDVYVGPFFAGQYVVVRKRLFMGFYRTTIQDLSGNVIVTLPWVTSSVFHWGNGLLMIEEQ